MKSVGIIGGLGPETTSEFYLEIIFQCQKRNDLQRPLIVISSVPLPFEIERTFLSSNKEKERYIPFLTTEAKRLERCGVDFLVMPCNSLHVFINEIRSSVAIPVMSIVEETIRYLQRNEMNRVGLISTSATIANRVYEGAFLEQGIDFVTPNDLQKAQMDKVIQRLISGQRLNSDREIILEIVRDFENKNVDCVTLACTDLQLLLPSSERIKIFDTMKVLSINATDYILENSFSVR